MPPGTGKGSAKNSGLIGTGGIFLHYPLRSVLPLAFKGLESRLRENHSD